MSDPLVHVQANALYDRLKPAARATLAAVNVGHWEQARNTITEIKSELILARSQGDAEESYLNDLFVLDAYSDLLLVYSELWQNVVEQRFAASWSSLQDALDLLRVIKRFSDIDVSFFEDQLTELEGLYPYGVFASVGMVVDGFDCNICSRDIDSDDCPHLRGRLYRGVMAHGIARGIRHLDHLALTTTPADKRCVIDYPNDGEQFKLVRFLSGLLKAKECRPSDFSHLRHSMRPLPDVGHKAVGRNDPCTCGSGKKFKKCCLGRPAREQKHVDIVAVPRSVETAVIQTAAGLARFLARPCGDGTQTATYHLGIDAGWGTNVISPLDTKCGSRNIAVTRRRCDSVFPQAHVPGTASGVNCESRRTYASPGPRLRTSSFASVTVSTIYSPDRCNQTPRYGGSNSITLSCPICEKLKNRSAEPTSGQAQGTLSEAVSRSSRALSLSVILQSRQCRRSTAESAMRAQSASRSIHERGGVRRA